MNELACDLWDDPSVADLFRAGDDESTCHNKLTFFENGLLAYATDLVPQLRVDRAREFLQRGFILRHMMMQRSRIQVRDRTIRRTEPLDPYLATELATHLNAYYLNLSAALDNLAWTISFELQLKDSLDEESWESRQFCTIASRAFGAALERLRPGLVQGLGPISDWAKAVKRLRDPAAHRLPLVLVSAMLTPGDLDHRNELTKLATDALIAGDLGRWQEVVRQRESLGYFLPVLGSPRSPNGELIVAPNQLASDQVEFLKAASLLLSRTFDQRYRSSTTD